MLALAWLGLTHRAHRDDWLRGEGVVAHGERDYRHRPARHGRDRMWGLVRCLWTPSSWASCLRLALISHSRTVTIKWVSVCELRRVC